MLKMILVKDRSVMITINEVKSKLKLNFILEQKMMAKNFQKFNDRWSKLEPFLS